MQASANGEYKLQAWTSHADFGEAERVAAMAEACSWAVAPCSVRNNLHSHTLLGTVSEQRMPWYRAHAQGQGQGREFQTLPLAVPLRSAHHRRQPPEAFRITGLQETAASWVAGTTGTPPSCVASTAAAPSAGAVAARTLSWDATAAANSEDGAFFGRRRELCRQKKSIPVPHAAGTGSSEMASVHSAATGIPAPCRAAGVAAATNRANRLIALPQNRAIQLGQQLYRELSGVQEVLDQTDEPLAPPSSTFSSSFTSSLQEVPDQIDEPLAQSSSSDAISLQEVPDQIDQPLAPLEDTWDMIDEVACSNVCPQEGGAEMIPDKALLRLDSFEKILNEQRRRFKGLQVMLANVLDPLPEEDLNEQWCRYIRLQVMLANLLDVQREGMGSPESHSSRSPLRQSADRAQLPGSVEEPGGDEDVTTPKILESAGFEWEQAQTNSSIWIRTRTPDPLLVTTIVQSWEQKRQDV